jgi:type I restriction enzyme M protein
MNTTESAASLVRRLWQYCNVLRDDGLSYPDYVEQLTYLLFLKMADEQSGADLIASAQGWRSFATLDAANMHERYGEVLAELGDREGTLGMIFRGARNKISDPGKLRLLVVELFGQTEWTGFSADVKGDAYEGLLEKNARDTKSGAGQYFTPRPLVEALVECVDPRPGEVVCDPACGTAGFLLAAHDHVARIDGLTSSQRRHLRTKALRGVELVHEVARLAAMNLYLHGVSGTSDKDVPIQCADSLREPPAKRVDVVLTNPPFGVKGSVTYANGAGRVADVSDDLVIVRPDFWARTANKQLNFLQHIVSLLKPGGRAAVVVPDNVLFEAGAAAAIRRRLLEEFDVHTLLRLPPGLFYAHGVLSNVLFFDAGVGASSRRELWTYDFRSANRFTLKSRPLRRQDLDEFVSLYKPGNVVDRVVGDETARWRRFDHADLLVSDGYRLDLSWEVNELDSRPATTGLARVDQIGLQVAQDLQRALAHFARVQSIDEAPTAVDAD